MNQLFPELEESQESAEGTASHGVGESLIGFSTYGAYPKAEEYVGGQAENGVTIDQDMYDGACMYADDVISVVSRTGEQPVVEQRVHASRIHPEAWGTPDCWLFDRNNGVLYLWDYKYGHEIVEAFENWQLLVYLCAVLEQVGLTRGDQDQHIRVVFRIVQPRSFHPKGPVREWSFWASDARGYFNILHHSAHEALSADAQTRSGPHCKHCKARHACEAALTSGMGLYEVAARPVPMNLDALSLGVQQTIVTRAIKQLEYLKSGYEAEIESRMRNGESVPYWRTEQGVGRETWSRPSEEVLRMGQMLGKDLRRKDPVTPKQAVSLGVDEAVIKGYSHKPRTGIKVVPDNGNRAKQVFSK